MDDKWGLVADIGRITVRFGLCRTDVGGGLLEARRQVALADHPTFTDALVSYLEGVGLRDATLPSVLAVAGAARGDVINLTGSRWFISLAGVETVLRARPRAINECAASALGLTTLGAGQLRPLTAAPPKPVRPGGSYLVIAPRTGLGVGALVSDGERLIPVQSEAGHMGFAPETADEARVVEALRRRGVTPSLESVLSLGGLERVHAILTDKESGPGFDALVRGGADRATAATFEVYAGLLGAALGDLVLAFGAWDGVFLCGPHARLLAPRISAATLARRMVAKDAFRRQLGQVPVAVALDDELELKGAAVALAA